MNFLCHVLSRTDNYNSENKGKMHIIVAHSFAIRLSPRGVTRNDNGFFDFQIAGNFGKKHRVFWFLCMCVK